MYFTKHLDDSTVLEFISEFNRALSEVVDACVGGTGILDAAAVTAIRNSALTEAQKEARIQELLQQSQEPAVKPKAKAATPAAAASATEHPLLINHKPGAPKCDICSGFSSASCYSPEIKKQEICHPTSQCPFQALLVRGKLSITVDSGSVKIISTDPATQGQIFKPQPPMQQQQQQGGFNKRPRPNQSTQGPPQYSGTPAPQPMMYAYPPMAYPYGYPPGGHAPHPTQSSSSAWTAQTQPQPPAQ